MHQHPITRWFRDDKRPASASASASAPSTTHRPRYALSLHDDGTALGPWRRRGYRTFCAQLAAEPLRASALAHAHAGDIAIALAFPACVDLCASGARWWKRKRAANPNFQRDAIERLRQTELLLRATKAPYAMFCPGTSLIKKMWKAPSAVISPHEYGGWLAEGQQHPLYPEVVPNRDAYHKRTYVFSGNGFVLPRRKPVTALWATVRRKGKLRRVSPLLVKRKHRNVRRLSPLGFLEAVARLHAPDDDGGGPR